MAEITRTLTTDSIVAADAAQKQLQLVLYALRLGLTPRDELLALDSVKRTTVSVRGAADTPAVSDSAGADRISAAPADTVVLTDQLVTEFLLRRRTPLYLSPAPGYKELFTIGFPSQVDADSRDTAVVPWCRRFNPDRAPYVEFYWDVTPNTAGDKATFKVLRWDGREQTFVLVETVTDLAPKTVYRSATGGATFMALLVTAITATGVNARDISVRAAQHFTYDGGH